eukprot:4929658-Pyramimonas_sp.AAC.1
MAWAVASGLCREASGGVPYGGAKGAAGATTWPGRGARPAPRGSSMKIKKYGAANREMGGLK